MNAKAKSSKTKKEIDIDFKGKSNTQPPYNHDINCFRCLGVEHIVYQCLNKRVMILKDHGEIESESDNNDNEMSSLKDVSDEIWSIWLRGNCLLFSVH